MKKLILLSLIQIVICQFTLFGSLKQPPPAHSGFFKPKKYKYEIAICAIFQNEAVYLREWIEFHKLVGVKHFYLFNNLSSDDYSSALAPYIKSGEVELFQWPYESTETIGWNEIQCDAYNYALKLAKWKVKWLAILDTDEFLFPVEVFTLSDFLLQFEDAAAVCVNWQMYGTSGVKTIPKNHLLIEDLVIKGETNYIENLHVKSIVRPEFVDHCSNPHFCVFKPGYFQVNSDKEPFIGPFTRINVDKIRINHYWTRDEDFFYQVKLSRRSKWNDGGCIERANNLTKEVDTSIFKYIPLLKKSYF